MYRFGVQETGAARGPGALLYTRSASIMELRKIAK